MHRRRVIDIEMNTLHRYGLWFMNTNLGPILFIYIYILI